MTRHDTTPAGAGREDRSREADGLQTGSHVAVRTRFDGSWAEGFEIVDSGGEGRSGYQVRRRYDDTVLPVRFDPAEVRRVP